MKVKKYIAESMPEAMKKIRTDFGSDAVILNSKEIKQGGLFGLFKKLRIEVIAAHDPQPTAPSKIEITSGLQVESKYEKRLQQTESEIYEDVLIEIKHLKKLMEQKKTFSSDHFPPDYEIIFNYLLEQEVTYELAKELLEAVVEQHKKNEIKPTGDLIVRNVSNEIEKRLANKSFESITYTNQIVQFIGPTGVGKTTTLAKIAAQSMLNDDKSVAFITADTYRIAAIEQLKTYAQILGVPIEVAYTIHDYEKAIKKFSAYDLILVDNAGRNFREENYVRELKSNLNIVHSVETYLVLALSAKPKDLIEIYDQFEGIPIKQVIFTKIDETTQFGSMLNIALGKDVGIAYLTDGQDVPEDLIAPNPKKISNYVMSGFYDS